MSLSPDEKLTIDLSMSQVELVRLMMVGLLNNEVIHDRVKETAASVLNTISDAAVMQGLIDIRQLPEEGLLGGDE